MQALRAAEALFDQNTQIGAPLDQDNVSALDAAIYHAKAVLYQSRALSSRFTSQVSDERLAFIQAIDQAISWKNSALHTNDDLQKQLESLTQATEKYEAIVCQ